MMVMHYSGEQVEYGGRGSAHLEGTTHSSGRPAVAGTQRAERTTWRWLPSRRFYKVGNFGSRTEESTASVSNKNQIKEKRGPPSFQKLQTPRRKVQYWFSPLRVEVTAYCKASCIAQRGVGPAQHDRETRGLGGRRLHMRGARPNPTADASGEIFDPECFG
ncbi:hypothetical protein EDB89DRAFT_1906206 [Lactarius sanguifluus]|nr:hypothetical protein EDB89DRAFT_1906206 [Lactarius sanguifluus]